MKKLLFLLPIFLLVGCSQCDQACYEAKSRYELQQAQIEQSARDNEFKREQELMATPGYKEKLQLELQERQARALEKQADDVGYMRDSQEVKDMVTVGAIGLSIVGALLSD